MSTVDPRSVDEARQQIRAIVAEIDQLGRSDLAEADFFRGLLDRVLETMGAVAGLVWIVGEGGRCEPVCHAGVPSTGLTASPEAQEAHGYLVESLLTGTEGMLLPARAQLAGPDGKTYRARIVDPVFFDKEGEKQKLVNSREYRGGYRGGYRGRRGRSR